MDPNHHPKIFAWRESFSGSLDYVNFLTRHATVGEWLAFSHVMWPEFVEYRGCVVLKFAFDAGALDDWHTQFGGDVARIESVVNRFVLCDFIDCGTDEASEEAVMEIAQRLAESWRAKLLSNFPGRSFAVDVASTDDGPVVSFACVARPPGA